MSAWETTGATDEWYTPKALFDQIGCQFDLDVAAPEDFSLCGVPADDHLFHDSLSEPWWGFIWMNPPFGGRNALTPWLDKFFAHGNGIALTPDRTSAPWFQSAWAKADAVLFTNGKPKFVRPDGSVGKSPGHGVTLWAAGDNAVEVLRAASVRGAGAFAVL